jgi:hypothetical protein
MKSTGQPESKYSASCTSSTSIVSAKPKWFPVSVMPHIKMGYLLTKKTTVQNWISKWFKILKSWKNKYATYKNGIVYIQEYSAKHRFLEITEC